MSFDALIGRIAKRVVGIAGNRLPPSASRDILDAALWRIEEVSYRRLRDRGFKPSGIVDIGAHRGNWSRTAREIFPTPPILMIEARDEQTDQLARVQQDLADIRFVISLLGSQSNALVEFQVCDSGSSMFAERSDTPRARKILPTRRLDDVIDADGRFQSDALFLKLDVQGAELEVLRGGPDTLSRAEVVQLEVAVLPYNEGAPQSAEIIAFMDSNGFAICDVAGFVRPGGKDLAAIDFLFARKDSFLRRSFFQFRQS